MTANHFQNEPDAEQIAAGNAGWPVQFRFAVHAGWSRVPELWTLGILATPFMKSKQLANVLIKMMGLSVCLYAIPSCVSGIIIAVMQPQNSNWGIEVMRIVSYAIGAGVQLAIGIAIIAMSQKISGWLFKSDDE